MNRILEWLVALVVGIVVGGGTFVWFGDYPSLAAALVLVYTVGAWLFIKFASTLPGEYYGDDWRTARWNAAFAGFMPFIGILVIGIAPISFELGVALLLLVMGVGWMGLFFGIATAREQAAANESSGESGPTNKTEQSDHPGASTEKA